MATYRRSALPALILTSRPTQGSKSITSMHRGAITFREHTSEKCLQPLFMVFPWDLFLAAEVVVPDLTEPNESTVHEPTEHRVDRSSHKILELCHSKS